MSGAHTEDEDALVRIEGEHGALERLSGLRAQLDLRRGRWGMGVVRFFAPTPGKMLPWDEMSKKHGLAKKRVTKKYRRHGGTTRIGLGVG